MYTDLYVYVNSLVFVRVKGCEGECFSVDSGVKQVCIMSPWLFNVYVEDGGENGDGEEGSEISRGGKRVEIAWPLVCG